MPFYFDDQGDDIVNRLFGLGGTDNTVIDQKQETVSSGPDKVNANWIATQFSPTERTLQYVGVYINDGHPAERCPGGVRDGKRPTDHQFRS